MMRLSGPEVAIMKSTRETRRDRWVSASLIVGAVLAGLAAVAAQRKGASAGPITPPPQPLAKRIDPPTLPSPPPAPPTQAARPRVEMVFALDTTGSMSGLIEGAKRKIWSIASFMAHGQPTPDLRVGLVAYRDIGDEYVTRVCDLDDDLDRVYRRLLAFRADGGGDGPEHVARALTEAVHKMSWSKGDAQVARLIYLVGDAPPHLDYHDGYDYAKASRDAVQMGIQVHAIRCGTDPETATHWRRIASLGHGEFLTINQDGGMRERRTPYDEELAKLHDELSDTVVPFGASAVDTRAALHAAAAAPAPVKAARAGYLSTKKEVADDLLEGVSSGRIDLDRVPAADLPASLAALPAPARKAKVAEASRARKDILDTIAKLSDKRDAYLSSQPAEAASGFDAEVEKTLSKASASIGVKR
jgi:hypothetical protein